MKKLMIVCLFLLSAGFQLKSVYAEESVEEVIRKIDQLYRSLTSRATIEMEIVTPNWQRKLTMEAWSEGMEKTFIRIHQPAKEKGVGTLRLKNEMWNYLPKTNKIIKVPPSMMMSSWMGSDFTNDDLVKEFSLFEDYTYEEVSPPNAEPELVYIKCIPREDLPVVWGSIVVAATRDGYLPVWQEYLDEQGKPIRVLTYSEIKDLADRRLPTVMEMVPKNKEGYKTVIRYLSLEFDVPADPATFSLRNLRSVH